MTADEIRECTVLFVLAICSRQDLRSRRIFLPVPLAGIAGAAAIAAAEGDFGWQMLFFGIIPGAALLLISRITEGAVGSGDGWVTAACGMLLGFWQVIGLLMTALILTAAAAGVMLAVLKKRGKDTLPFVPFLMAAYLMQLAVEII